MENNKAGHELDDSTLTCEAAALSSVLKINVLSDVITQWFHVKSLNAILFIQSTWSSVFVNLESKLMEIKIKQER